MTGPLRLVLVTSKLSPAAGGLATSVPAMAKGLARFADLDVTVLGTQDPAAPQAWSAWGPKVLAERVRGPAALQFAPRMPSRLARLTPEVTDVQGLWTWPSAANLIHHRRNGTPYVVTPRGMLAPWARRNSAWKKVLINALYEASHIRGASCLRATAEMEAAHFRSLGLRNPIAIVPNGVSIPPLAPRCEKSLRRVLFLSRIHPVKGITHLLRAWADLEPRHPDWELVVAGPDEIGHTAELQELSSTLGLGRVTFPGPAFGEAKQQLYGNADLFVLPSYTENFGQVIAEALAQEVPVITTRNTPWAGLESQRCGWWIPLDEAQLTAAMTEAMSMPSEALHAMGRRGRLWMQRDFGWESVVERLRAMYHWVAKSGARPDCVHLE